MIRKDTILQMNQIFLVLIFFASCINNSAEIKNNNSGKANENVESLKSGLLSENFESGSKAAYAEGTVNLSSGLWKFNNALLGNSSNDKKNGAQAARINSDGSIVMMFDKNDGAGTVTVNYAMFGNDSKTDWQLLISVDQGINWKLVGETVSTESKTLIKKSFTINQSGNVRFQIAKTSANGRLNIDDFAVTDYGSGSQIENVPTKENTSQNKTTSNGTVKILFDNTKAETAGNADWVIDEDLNNLKWTNSGATTAGQEGNAQRIPTPSQSDIKANTPETYWKGALSAWAIDCVKKGFVVETLPYNGKITYEDNSNLQDLFNYQIYVVDEPNGKFSDKEKTAIIQFVKNGGSLVMISDHTISDRDGDGYDSPAIWNDLMENNDVQPNPFGITFDLVNISGIYTSIADLPSNQIINGNLGAVKKVKWSNGTTMSLDTHANPNVKGLIYKSSLNSGNSGVLVASSVFGKGKVIAIGDSSVPDDGTGDENDKLYNGYSADADGNHRVLLMNAIEWLAE